MPTPKRAKWPRTAVVVLATVAITGTAASTSTVTNAAGSKTPTSDPAVCVVIRSAP